MSRRPTGGEPVPIAEALAQVGAQLGLGSTDTFTQVTDAWRAVAGDALAAHSQVRSLRDGTCTVEVDGPAWATRARYLTAAFVEAANEAAGASVATPVVRACQVVVAGPATTR